MFGRVDAACSAPGLLKRGAPAPFETFSAVSARWNGGREDVLDERRGRQTSEEAFRPEGSALTQPSSKGWESEQ